MTNPNLSKTGLLRIVPSTRTTFLSVLRSLFQAYASVIFRKRPNLSQIVSFSKKHTRGTDKVNTKAVENT